MKLSCGVSIRAITEEDSEQRSDSTSLRVEKYVSHTILHALIQSESKTWYETEIFPKNILVSSIHVIAALAP